MEWSDEKCLTLIELYRNYTVLWDPQDENFKNKNLKEDAWVEIGRGMDIPGEICKNKISAFGVSKREIKTKKEAVELRRVGASEIYQSNWFAFEPLSFLMDRDKPRQSLNTENNNSAIPDLPSTAQTSDRPPSPRNVTAENPAPPTPPIKRKYDPELAMLKDAFGILKSVSTKANQEDEIDTFCKFLENKLRSYDHRTKNLVQQRLCDIIFKADVGYFTNNEQYGNYTRQRHNFNTTQPEIATLNQNDSKYASPTASTSHASIGQSSPSESQNSTDSFDFNDYI